MHFRRLALRLTNLVHTVFVVLTLNSFLLIYLLYLGKYLFHQVDHIFQPPLWPLQQSEPFLLAILPIFYILLTLLLLSALLLFHLTLYLPVWMSFVQTLSFIAAFTLLALCYLYSLIRQHYSQLAGVLRRVSSKLDKRKCRRTHHHHHHHHLSHHFNSLRSILQANLHLFCAVFAGDAYLGQLFTIYLGLHLPLSVYATLLMVFGYLKSLLVGLIFLSLVTEALFGSAFIHLAVAKLSSVLHHKGGRLLVAFTAKSSASCGKDDNCHGLLPARLAIHLSCHISRLLVRKKYGICYGILGTLVTMKTFFKVRYVLKN